MAGCVAESADTGGDPIAACIDEFSEANGYDFGTEDPATVAADCTAGGGSNCADDYITEAAAVCIAEQSDLPPGVTDWSTDLLYNSAQTRVIWVVYATIATDGESSNGSVMSIDASAGTVVDTSDWAMGP